jgi:hypothetical protein
MGSGTLSTAIFFLIVANMFLYFVLGIFFDGGAFPYGEIEQGRFWVDNNDGRREVSEAWFRFTFWQGIGAWSGLGLFFAVNSTRELFRTRGFSSTFKVLILSIAFYAWTLFIVLIAMNIVSG